MQANAPGPWIAVPKSSIFGSVFLNCDGSANLSNPVGLTNLTVSLETTNGTVLETTNTDKNGAYSFINLTPGMYIVAVTPPANYVQTFPPGDTTNAVLVTLPGCDNQEVDFGYADKKIKEHRGEKRHFDRSRSGACAIGCAHAREP